MTAYDRENHGWRSYPRGLLVLALATFVLFLARGMVLPFLMIYFAQIVGLGESLAGAGIALSSVVGVVATLALARTIDRSGARRILLLALLAMAAVHATLWLGRSPGLFLCLMSLFGIAINVYWPASDTLATAFLPPERAGEVFGLQRVANALGLGLGGLIGGWLVTGGDPAAYRTSFLVSSAGILCAALLIWWSVPAVHRRSALDRTALRGDWRGLLADRRFLASQLLLLLGVTGFTQFQVSVPPFLREEAGFRERTIGALFAVNTLVVVLAQVPVARWTTGRPFGHLFAATGIGWAIAYTSFALAPQTAAAASVGVLVYSLAELLFMPVSGAVVVALSSPYQRARALAFASVVWAIGWGGAAWIAGVLLERQLAHVLWSGTVAVMLGLAILAARLTAFLGGRPSTEPPVSTGLERES
jgi:predicted MFS family arabinose efflux permease